MEAIETAKWFIELITELVLIVAPIILVMVQKGKFDLFKTLEAAKDVTDMVRGKLEEEDAPDFEKILEDAVSQVEGIRGKKLSPKLKRKAKARIAATVKSGG